MKQVLETLKPTTEKLLKINELNRVAEDLKNNGSVVNSQGTTIKVQAWHSTKKVISHESKISTQKIVHCQGKQAVLFIEVVRQYEVVKPTVVSLAVKNGQPWPFVC